MNRIGRKLIIIGIFLIIISAFLLIYNKYEEKEAGIKSAAVLDAIKTNLVEKEQLSNSFEKKEMQTINIKGYDYIGTITIPSLNLELPIMSEYEYDYLKIAPCRYYGSIYTNDLVICAHSYRTHFRYISNLKQGDKVLFTDINGEIYIYEVLELEVLEPTDISEMIDNEFDLTLYTCTNDGLDRVTVRCNRVVGKI